MGFQCTQIATNHPMILKKSPTKHAGSPRINTLPLRTFPEPTRSLHGPSRNSPGLKIRPGLSRMTPAILNIAGPSRTITDHPGLSRITTEPTRIWPRIGKNSVRDSPGRWCDCRFSGDNIHIANGDALTPQAPVAWILQGSVMTWRSRSLMTWRSRSLPSVLGFVMVFPCWINTSFQFLPCKKFTNTATLVLASW